MIQALPGVITGRNRELQNAIQRSGNVDSAFAKLTYEEVEILLKNYMKRLQKNYSRAL